MLAAGAATVAEEMPEAYKDVADVVEVVHDAGHRPEGGATASARRDQGVIKG